MQQPRPARPQFTERRTTDYEKGPDVRAFFMGLSFGTDAEQRIGPRGGKIVGRPADRRS